MADIAPAQILTTPDVTIPDGSYTTADMAATIDREYIAQQGAPDGGWNLRNIRDMHFKHVSQSGAPTAVTPCRCGKNPPTGNVPERSTVVKHTVNPDGSCSTFYKESLPDYFTEGWNSRNIGDMYFNHVVHRNACVEKMWTEEL